MSLLFGDGESRWLVLDIDIENHVGVIYIYGFRGDRRGGIEDRRGIKDAIYKWEKKRFGIESYKGSAKIYAHFILKKKHFLNMSKLLYSVLEGILQESDDTQTPIQSPMALK